jgi:hypothetical protein
MPVKLPHEVMYRMRCLAFLPSELRQSLGLLRDRVNVHGRNNNTCFVQRCQQLCVTVLHVGVDSLKLCLCLQHAGLVSLSLGFIIPSYVS